MINFLYGNCKVLRGHTQGRNQDFAKKGGLENGKNCDVILLTYFR